MLLTRRWSAVLLAAAVWTAWVWGTRLVNLWSDERSRSDGALNAFFWVHVAVAAGSLAFAAAFAWLGVRGWRAARDVRPGGRSARA